MGIFTQKQLMTKLIFYMVVTQEQITVNTLNFLQMFILVLFMYGNIFKIF